MIALRLFVLILVAFYLSQVNGAASGRVWASGFAPEDANDAVKATLDNIPVTSEQVAKTAEDLQARLKYFGEKAEDLVKSPLDLIRELQKLLPFHK